MFTLNIWLITSYSYIQKHHEHDVSGHADSKSRNNLPIAVNTVKLVYKDHPRDQQNVVLLCIMYIGDLYMEVQ